MSKAPPPSGVVSVGHPVDVASGVVFTAWDDLDLRGPFELKWSRFYATSDLTRTALGVGWRNPYFSELIDVEGGTIYSHDDGEITLVPDPDSGLIANTSHKVALFDVAPERSLWSWGERKWHVFARDPHAPDRWRLTRIESAAGYVTHVVHDATGALRELHQDPLRRIQLQYGSRGLIEAVDVLGAHESLRMVSYEYDTRDRLVAVYDATGTPIRYAYDDESRMVRETNRLGGSFYFEYDVDGRCVHTFGENGMGDRRLVFDARARTTRVTDAQGGLTVYHLNERGQVTREVDPLGAVLERVFDAQGRTVVTRFPLDAFLELQYDARGDLTGTVDGLGRRTQYEYNELHLVTKRRTPDGQARTYEYDARGNLVARTNELGGRYEYLRDERGRLQEAVTPGGHRTTVVYDPWARWHELRDPYGFRRYEFDVLGQLVMIVDDLGMLERREYDLRGNLTAYINPDGSAFRLEFDGNGNVVAETDETGLRTAHYFDPYDQLLMREHADGSRASFRYDIEGRLVEIENENGERATFAYNAIGCVTEQWFFDGRVERYGYDSAGNLVTIVRPDGTPITQMHNAVGNIVEMAGGEFRLVFEFDACDRVLKAETPDCAVLFVYDAMGRVVRESQRGEVVAYAYDADGNRTRVHHEGGPAGTVTFEYDGRRRLRRLSGRPDLQQEFEYRPDDRLAIRHLQGVGDESFEYDVMRRLVEQSVRLGQRVMIARSFRHDSAGRLTEMRDIARGDARYAYDARERLARVEASDGIAQFRYDRAGNPVLLRDRPATSRGNRLLAAGATQYAYDANGDLTAIEGAVPATYAFDAGERLVGAHTAGADVRFVYDAFARRVTKTVDDRTTRYVWAGSLLLAEIGPDGDYVGHALVAFHPFAQFASGAWSAVVTDEASVPMELVDAHGHVAWRATYDVLGGLVEEKGDARGSSLRLLGQLADAETGLHYNRFRYYDPAVGRFISPDPIGLFGGLNEYRYIEDPLNWEDVLGLKCKLIHFRVVMRLGRGPRSQWLAKRDAFNQARQNPNARVPSQKDYDNRIRPTADREAAAARAAGGFGSNQDADHPGDVRATGLLGQTLEPRTSGVNRSFGSQVGRQAGARPAGSRTPMVDLVDDNGNVIP